MNVTDPPGKQNYICPMCGEPIDLNRDETADEDGRVMHAECYFKRVGGHGNDPPDPRHVA